MTQTATELGLLLLRVASGGLMLVHGIPKLLGFSELSSKFPDPLGVGNTASLVMAVFGEVVCSILIMLGLGTRFVALPYIATMVVAVGIVHAGDPWGARELAAVYLVLGVLVALLGPGKWSIDAMLAARREKR